MVVDPNALEQAQIAATGEATSLPRPPQRGGDDRFTAELVDAVQLQERETVLVLDDLQRLPELASHELESLLDRFPAGQRLVISSRVSPPLPLQRFKVTGNLLDLRATELSFRDSEAADLLHRHGVTFSQTDFERLMARTGGWPAGLRLAALALSESDDPSALALLLVAFLLPAAVLMHGFWKETDAQARQMEMVQFMKDAGLAGAALMLFAFFAHNEDLGLAITGPLFSLG